jgi:hypothetical protein
MAAGRKRTAIVSRETAVDDIDGRRLHPSRRDIPRLNLIGWSWGTALVASHLPGRQIAACCTPQLEAHSSPSTGPPAARRYRRDCDQVHERWLNGVRREKER